MKFTYKGHHYVLDDLPTPRLSEDGRCVKWFYDGPEDIKSHIVKCSMCGQEKYCDLEHTVGELVQHPEWRNKPVCPKCKKQTMRE